ncbi:MAG: hypothetical protein JKX84_08735 [Flavobacteriales bacterium]|nr:hypothetical protein [Flavobacteriales bacterium]
MKIFLVTFLLLICTGFGNQITAQDTISKVKFEFSHSRRIPFCNISIEIDKKEKQTQLHLISWPMNKDSMWAYSRVDTVFEISQTDFKTIVDLLLLINEKDIEKNKDYHGLDGTDCTISFGAEGNMKTYWAWSPGYGTERNLTEFWKTCKLIVKTAGLKPRKVL